MKTEHKTQKTILIAVIVALFFLALAEGVLLLRASRFGASVTSASLLQSLFAPHYEKSHELSGENESLMLQETAEDLERLHAQINSLFSPHANFQFFDDEQRLQSEIEHIFRNAREGRHSGALRLLEKDWHDVATISSLDIQEGETNYEIAVSMPEFQKNEININIHGRILSIEAKKNQRESGAGRRAETSGRFNTQIMLPADTKGEAAQASYSEGMLKITVPKTAPTNSLAHNVPIM